MKRYLTFPIMLPHPVDHIPEPYQSQLRDMLMKHADSFGNSISDIKGTNVYEHHIELSDPTPAYMIQSSI